MRSIQNEIINRGIENIYHFTTIENLMSILERGFIYSRSKVNALRKADDGFYSDDYVDYMDEKRLDGLCDYINLSVSRPNWYLMNSYSKKIELADFEWCIIELTTESLSLADTLFSVGNAASSVSKKYGVTSGLKAFDAMFQEEVITTRKKYTRFRLPDNFTTDIQAEALVKDQIAIDKIKHIYLASNNQLMKHRSGFKLLNLDNSLFEVNEEMFKSAILK